MTTLNRKLQQNGKRRRKQAIRSLEILSDEWWKMTASLIREGSLPSKRRGTTTTTLIPKQILLKEGRWMERETILLLSQIPSRGRPTVMTTTLVLNQVLPSERPLKQMMTMNLLVKRGINLDVTLFLQISPEMKDRRSLLLRRGQSWILVWMIRRHRGTR